MLPWLPLILLWLLLPQAIVAWDVKSSKTRLHHPLAAKSRAFVSSLRGRVGLSGLFSSAPAVHFVAQPLVSAGAEGGANWTGRVHVTSFGADPSGQRDSSAAIQLAINAAWTIGAAAGVNMTAEGGPDLGGVIVDFDSGHYLLRQPLTLPSSGGGNIVFTSGALHADTVHFPASRYLLELPVITAERHALRFRWLTFENIEFDASHHAAGGVM